MSFETNISLSLADHENRNKKSFEEVNSKIAAFLEKADDLRDELQAIRDDIAIYKQNLMELNNMVENENVPRAIFEREIRFLKTMIEEFSKAKKQTFWDIFKK